MTDLIRLMFDDGPTRVVKTPNNAYATFRWRGKRWAAYLVTDESYNGLNWHLDATIDNPASNGSLRAFLADPEGFVSRHAPHNRAQPGWDQSVRGRIRPPDRIALRFEEIP